MSRPHLTLVPKGKDGGDDEVEAGQDGPLSGHRTSPTSPKASRSCPCPYHRLARGESVLLTTVETDLFGHGRDCIRRLLAECAKAMLRGDVLLRVELYTRILHINALLLQESVRFAKAGPLGRQTAD